MLKIHEVSMQTHGKITALSLFAKFGISAFYLAVIFQFQEYQVLVLIFLSNMCWKSMAFANLG